MQDEGIEQLIGKTLKSVVQNEHDDEILFKTEDGFEYKMFHNQDCCENVSVESIAGDLQDIIGSPVIVAEEVSNSEEYPPDVEKSEYTESFTWTFYKIETLKGGVTIRWFGSSNGYYSETVYFKKI